MKMNETLEQRADELDWLAFCFVSGDLSDEDREAFELRLENDQAAREAVARAAELVQSVALAESQSAARVNLATAAHRPALWRTVTWIGAAGAAAAAILILAGLWNRVPDGAGVPSLQADLAKAWSRAGESVRDALASESVADDFNHESAAMEPLAVDGLPSWMTEAVMSQAASADADLDGKPDEEWDDARLEN